MKLKKNKIRLFIFSAIILIFIFLISGCQEKTAQTSVADISTTSVAAVETTGAETSA